MDLKNVAKSRWNLNTQTHALNTSRVFVFCFLFFFVCFLKPLYTTSLLAVNLSSQTPKIQLVGIKLNLAIRIRKKLNLAKFQLKVNHDILRGIAGIF